MSLTFGVETEREAWEREIREHGYPKANPLWKRPNIPNPPHFHCEGCGRPHWSIRDSGEWVHEGHREKVKVPGGYWSWTTPVDYVRDRFVCLTCLEERFKAWREQRSKT